MGHALNLINQAISGSQVNEFSLSFIRSNNSKNGERGSCKKVPRCQKYFKEAKATSGKGRGRSMPRMKGNILMVKDMDTEQILSVKLYTIVEFNGMKVRH